MGLIGLFDIGKSALFASQAALSVTSNNIANANTPGYSREDVILQVATPQALRNGMLGRGVTIAGVRRSYDRFLESQLLGQRQSLGRSEVLDQLWTGIVQTLNGGMGYGLEAPLSDFFNAWQDVAAQPESSAARSVLLQKANALISSAGRTEKSMVDAIQAANDGIADAVRQVNALAGQIAALNDQIVQIEAGGTSEAVGLRDQRDNLVGKLSDLIDFASLEDQNGALSLTVGMRSLVEGGRTNTLSAPTGTDGNRMLVIDGIDITGRVLQGKIGGLIAGRGDLESQVLTPLRRLMAAVIQQVNTVHRNGYGLDASTGNSFFGPLQLSVRDDAAAADVTSALITDESLLTLDEYRIGFDGAGNYVVQNAQTGGTVASGAYNAGGTVIALPGMSVTLAGAATQADSFVVSPLTAAVRGLSVAVTDPRQVAASSTAAGLPGNNAAALSLVTLASTGLAVLGNASFQEYYNGISSSAGVLGQAAADGRAFDENLYAELQNRRESLSGVSLDEEAANLIRYQRAFEAGARMIKVADELLQTVLEL